MLKERPQSFGGPGWGAGTVVGTKRIGGMSCVEEAPGIHSACIETRSACNTSLLFRGGAVVPPISIFDELSIMDPTYDWDCPCDAIWSVGHPMDAIIRSSGSCCGSSSRDAENC